MPSTINATSTGSGGLISTGDASGQLELQANGSTKLTVSSSGVTIPTLVGANVNLASNVTGTLPVANGGTGATTLTSNNVILGNGTSAVQFVAPGTNGNVLTSNGTTWQSTAPSGAGLVYISSATTTGASTLGFTSGFSATYDMYLIKVEELSSTVNGHATLWSRLFINSSLVSAGYSSSFSFLADGVVGGDAEPNRNQGVHTKVNSNYLQSDYTYFNNGEFRIYFANSSTNKMYDSYINANRNNVTTNPQNATCFATTYLPQTGTITGFQLLLSTGSNIKGTLHLYGYKQS